MARPNPPTDRARRGRLLWRPGALCLWIVAAGGGCADSYGQRHAITHPGSASLWADWIKDEGKKFDMRAVLRNVSSRPLVVGRGDFDCSKGPLTGQLRILDGATSEVVLRPGQEVQVVLVCHLGRKVKGPFRLTLHRVRDAATRKPLVSLVWSSAPAARRATPVRRRPQAPAARRAPPPRTQPPPHPVAPVAPGRPARAPVVAVFEVENRGTQLGAEMLARLTEYLSAQLTATGRFQVIPRGQLRRRLSQEKRASYRKCVDQSCQIEIGRELAAQKSLSCSVMRLGSKCMVNAVLYDLKRAATERAGSAKGACTEDGIVASLERVVKKLSDR